MFFDISKFKLCNVLVVGDLMVDEYLWGNVDRISPEAPVQVVSVQEEVVTLGGSGNVVNNLVSLGAKVSLAGVTGADKYGGILLTRLKKLGVDTTGVVKEPDRSTTRKTRILARNQQVLRIDRETTTDITKKTFNTVLKYIKKVILDTDLILISDYGKGLITPSLIKNLVSLADKHNKFSVADPKGLDFIKYSGVSLLTPNKKEAALASGIEINNEQTLIKAGKKILKTANIKNLLITCGRDGMVLFQPKKKPYYINAQTKQVFDVSGAGDTVMAVMGLAFASGASLEEAASVANKAAGIVVGKVGTATVSKEELSAALTPETDFSIKKHIDIKDLPSLVNRLKNNNKKIVMTNGCFDLLHAGHVMFLASSKKLGDVLIVAIDDDDSIKKLKGQGRPVISIKERIRILSALDSVDYIIVFSSKQLNKTIEIIRPDILTKGSNYIFEEVVGREIVEKSGGSIIRIPVTENISSSMIIDNIKNSSII